MTQVIEWRFAGTQTVYQTSKDKFATTATRLRNSMNLHAEHEIIIENDFTITEHVNDVPAINSDQHVDQPATVSKSSKKITPVDETPELSDLSGDLGSTDAEPAIL